MIKKFPKLLYSSLIAGFAMTACHPALHLQNVHTEKNIAISDKIADAKEYETAIAPYRVKMQGEMNRKIAYTAEDLNKNGINNTLGALLADYTLDTAKNWAKNHGGYTIDGAVINIGGIRSVISAGDITVKSVLEVMPFENELVLVRLNGTQMQGLIDYYVHYKKNNPIAGMKIDIEGSQGTLQLMNGRAIVPTETYYIATSDYLALGGDNMDFFTKGEMIPTGEKLREIYKEQFSIHKNIIAPKDIRLTFDGKN